MVRLPDGATPHSLKLEIDPAAMPAPKPKAKKTKAKAEAAPTPVVEEEEIVEEVETVNEAPSTDNPEDWEAFLADEGLAVIEDDLSDDVDDSLFGDF